MSKVQLYVYDLSNGLAKNMSLQLTGKQIDGIWSGRMTPSGQCPDGCVCQHLDPHTSVVVFGKEVFYGQGVCITPPGQSHHGKPLHVVDLGETAIDEDTFQEYLAEMREHYTADKYHLLDFNCNSFTNDCAGFLTGNSIPSWIKDLPSDFLSTPFGAALRPTIDAMYRRPVPGSAPTPATVGPSPEAAAAAASASPNPALASALLQAVASQAFSAPSGSTPPPSAPSPPTSTVAGPIHMCTNSSSMHSLLRAHRAVVVFFTSATCAPCRAIAPVFEDLAREKTQGPQAGGTAFVKVDTGVGMGGLVGNEWNVRATPTFLFFLDGKKIHELKDANRLELRTQVDLLLFQAFPPHPHASLSLPAVDALSMNPILFTQAPALDTVLAKLTAFIAASSLSPTQAQIAKQTLATVVLPYLKGRVPSATARAPSASPQLLASWADATRALAGALPAPQLFPLADLWRLALLDQAVGAWTSTAPVLLLLVDHARRALDARSYVLTVLRMLANACAHATLARALLAETGSRDAVTAVLVEGLLHADAAVRTAAASVAFNIAALLQAGRRGAGTSGIGGTLDGEWEVEVVSVILQALGDESQSEDVVHRLTAALAFLLRSSPLYEGQLSPLLEVLQARVTVRGTLERGGVARADVRRLVEEVADKLCP